MKNRQPNFHCIEYTRSQTRNSQRARRVGFTLLETILAIALSALLFGLIASGMRIYSNIVSDRRADVVNAQVARVILQQIASDVRSTFYAAPDEEGGGGLATIGGGEAGATDDESTTISTEETVDATLDLTGNTVQSTPGLYGNSFELQIDALGQLVHPLKFDMLTALGADPVASNLLSDPKVITYYMRSIDPGELSATPLATAGNSFSDGMQTVFVRRVQSRAGAIFAVTAGIGGDLQAGEQLLSNQVVAVQFSYHDGYDWLDTWDSSIAGLPIAVNITLTLVDEVASDTTDLNTLTTDNVFQMTVRLPTAEPPVDDAATLGL